MIEQREYEDREAREHQRALRDVETAPLAERKEACQALEEAVGGRPGAPRA